MAQPRPWILEDSAIDSQEQDRFDHLSVARELSVILRGSRQSLAIGLLGPFGSGKSSVVRLLDAELKGNKDWAVVHLSAERHSGTARARGLLYGLLDDLKRQDLINDKTWHSERACLESGRQRVDSRRSATSGQPGTSRRKYVMAALEALGWMAATLGFIWLIGAVLVLIGRVVGVGVGVSPWAWFASPGASPLVAVAFSAAVAANLLGTVKEGALAALKRYDITLTTPRPESTDDLEQVFARLIGGIRRRLVIAIDDIDRLSATEVLEALTTVRSLLLTGTHHTHPPVFLLSCDEDIVREAIVGVRPGLAHRPAHTAEHDSSPSPTAAPERKATEEAAQEYLNKLFTVRMVLPAHHGGDLRDYAERLLTHPTEHGAVAALGGMQRVHDVLDLVVHQDVKDPRHVIRLLNAFLADYALAMRRERPDETGTARIAPGEVTGHPLTLARLTVLRHDFPGLHHAIRTEHDLLAVLDDALLGSTTAVNDPLLRAFTQTVPTQDIADGQQTVRRLNTTAQPGLTYLLATAGRTRTGRPAHLMPLLTLGSTPASRLLGSEQAAAIHRELVQRDTEAFTTRLIDTQGRHRILSAAAHTIAQARQGLDVENALTAAVQALGRIPDLADHAAADPQSARALQALTEEIARRRADAATPLPAHDLIAALDLFPEAYLPALHQALSTPPAPVLEGTPGAEQPAFLWAQALIALPAGRHADQLHAPLTDYLTTLADNGSTGDLTTWITAYENAPAKRREAWPPQAHQALLAMATRVGDDKETQRVHQITVESAGVHQWQRPVAEGLLAWLATDDNNLRAKAVELLDHATVPEDGWGHPVATPTVPADSTLAAQIAERAANFLEDDDDAGSSQATAKLLHTWLPTIGHHAASTPGAKVSTVTARAVGNAAHTCLDLAADAASIMADLPEQDAAVCAVAIIGNLHDPIVTEAVRDALVEAVITYLRHTQHSEEPEVREAAGTCVAALTASLNQPDERGAHARRCLPALMTTQQGRAEGSRLADQLMMVLGNYNQPHIAEVLEGLQVLFRDPDLRTAKLAGALQHLQNWIGSAPVPAVTFAAHHAQDAAVSVTWLSWIAQFWQQLPPHARTSAVAAADRSDLRETALPSLLVQQILDGSDTMAWAHAASVWDKVAPTQQASLLATANGRCPDLAERANEAAHTILNDALDLADTEQLPALLELIAHSGQFTEAVCAHVQQRLADRDWDAARMTDIVTAVADSPSVWDVLFEEAGSDQTTLGHATSLIGVLISVNPDCVPAAFIEHMGAALQTATPANASALGQAVRPLPDLARRLGRTLTGQGKTPEGKERMRAFKSAAGIR
ncbi:P-loop NTPase fold protein [Streptomyces sp. NPDC088090]|uniref:P-loop NTPase fold protein n=1 Tax=Streptomyces sp. NPDC088090 TaxID=3365822 RepID=UPI00384D460B